MESNRVSHARLSPFPSSHCPRRAVYSSLSPLIIAIFKERSWKGELNENKKKYIHSTRKFLNFPSLSPAKKLALSFLISRCALKHGCHRHDFWPPIGKWARTPSRPVYSRVCPRERRKSSLWVQETLCAWPRSLAKMRWQKNPAARDMYPG